MFGIGTSELIVIALIVFLIYGPERLPDMVRKVMKFTKEVKDASEQVTGVIRREVHNFEIMTKHPETNVDEAEAPPEEPHGHGLPPAHDTPEKEEA